MDQNSKAQLELINQQIKELVGLYRDAVGYTGTSENEFWIWYTLVAVEGEFSQQDICAMWSMSKQTVNTIITNMVRKGYVVLEVVPGTRNRKTVRLTQEGRAYGNRLITPVSEAEQRAFSRLPEADRVACTVALSKYISILREELHRAGDR